jgi:hypothetical protein
MARRNPTISKVAPDPGPLPGIDNLPNPIGINMKAQAQAEEMPGHGAVSVSKMSMQTNDGDQKGAPDAPFADGKDMREPDKRGGANPCPAKPGC